LGFLLPVLQAAYCIAEDTFLIIFPNKALAQDQLVKVFGIGRSILRLDLQGKVVPATSDSDCSHVQRSLVAASANIILTNPDTLSCGQPSPLIGRAFIVPSAARLVKLRYVVIDKANMYEGVFGAHIAMVLARLYRVATLCRGSNNNNNNNKVKAPITFWACSATMADLCRSRARIFTLCRSQISIYRRCLGSNRPVNEFYG
jgi:ATP-dependent helicase YprA (DUF1998 family)